MSIEGVAVRLIKAFFEEFFSPLLTFFISTASIAAYCGDFSAALLFLAVGSVIQLVYDYGTGKIS